MKKLQNDFTTTEQSKRLVELGVPADSADCYFGSYPGHPDWAVIRQSEFDTEDDALFRLNKDIIPCWSVGRLMEIYDTCVENTESWPTVKQGISYVINAIVAIDYAVRNGRIDFSKLEEYL